LGKYAKLLGKSIKTLRVIYDENGVTVEIDGVEGTPYAGLEEASIAAFKAVREKENSPSDAEALRAFRNKFELRLNREFPANGPASGSNADIQSFLDTLPFRERRALMMSQKQFEKNYPNGFTQA
jgi:hypothetical protein